LNIKLVIDVMAPWRFYSKELAVKSLSDWPERLVLNAAVVFFGFVDTHFLLSFCVLHNHSV